MTDTVNSHGRCEACGQYYVPAALVWLANAESEMELAERGHGFGVALAILTAYAPSVHKWLDRIEDRDAETLARIAALWAAPGYAWEQLDSESWRKDPVITVWRRLHGLNAWNGPAKGRFSMRVRCTTGGAAAF